LDATPGDYIKVRNKTADDTMTIQADRRYYAEEYLCFREYLYKQSYTNYGTPFPIYEYSLVPNWSAGLGVAAPSQITYSDEIQLHGDSFEHHLHWQTGLYFDTVSPHAHDDIDIASYYDVATVTYQSLNWKKASRRVTGRRTYDLTDKLSVTVGGPLHRGPS